MVTFCPRGLASTRTPKGYRMNQIALASVTGFSLALPAVAAAGTALEYGYELTIDGGQTWGYNAPRVGVANTGSTELASLHLSIGDSAYNFDNHADPLAVGDLTANVLSPVAENGGPRSEEFYVLFEGMGIGESWSAALDIDRDDLPAGKLGSREDFRNVLLGDGGTAKVTVTFVDGFVLDGFLPAEVALAVRSALLHPQATSYGLSGDVLYYAQGVAAAPMPTASLAGLSLLSALLAGRRRLAA